MTVVGLDIGGANLKIADTRGNVVTEPFPLWQRPHELPGTLGRLLAAFPDHARLAVTMTGELADCFASKRDGVQRIIRAVVDAAADRPVCFYQTSGQWVDAQHAAVTYRRTAAANWHLLAQFVSRYVTADSALLLDIGSTTCDIIPLVQRAPRPSGYTDLERLMAGELVYSGVERSPVCAVVRWVPLCGAECPVAGELFATMLDVYLLLGDLPQQAEACDTADGRPRLPAWAHARLARMLCADTDEVSREQITAIARHVAGVQAEGLARSVRRVLRGLPSACRQVIVAGHGDFLARRVVERAGVRAAVDYLSEHLSAAQSRAATAVAAAYLASDHTLRTAGA